MKKLLVTFPLFISLFCFSQKGVMLDIRDEGRMYNTVVIGNQTWMAQNLNATTFRNGDIIPEAKTNEEWVKADKKKQPAWCFYRGNSEEGWKYGKLYNWYAVNDSRGLAPDGWHIPSSEEWTNLINYLGTENIGEKIKTTEGWFQDGNGNNESGFSGFPGGHRNYAGEWNRYNGADGYWWSSTKDGGKKAKAMHTNSFTKSAFLRTILMIDGCSIRCVKD